MDKSAETEEKELLTETSFRDIVKMIGSVLNVYKYAQKFIKIKE